MARVSSPARSSVTTCSSATRRSPPAGSTTWPSGHWHSFSRARPVSTTWAYPGAPEPVAVDQDGAGQRLPRAPRGRRRRSQQRARGARARRPDRLPQRGRRCAPSIGEPGGAGGDGSPRWPIRTSSCTSPSWASRPTPSRSMPDRGPAGPGAVVPARARASIARSPSWPLDRSCRRTPSPAGSSSTWRRASAPLRPGRRCGGGAGPPGPAPRAPAAAGRPRSRDAGLAMHITRARASPTSSATPSSRSSRPPA